MAGQKGSRTSEDKKARKSRRRHPFKAIMSNYGPTRASGDILVNSSRPTN